MHRTRTIMALAVATAGLALTAACSSGSGGSSQPGNTPPPPPPSPTSTVISAQATPLGTVLVNDKGLTVYVFANDKTTASTCNGTCAVNWPPVVAPATLPASIPGVTGALGTTTRTDGSHQLTVAGHPVYTFKGDSAAGQTNGQGITLDGGLWTVVLPSGAADPNPAGAAQPNPGGAGY